MATLTFEEKMTMFVSLIDLVCLRVIESWKDSVKDLMWIVEVVPQVDVEVFGAKV